MVVVVEDREVTSADASLSRRAALCLGAGCATGIAGCLDPLTGRNFEHDYDWATLAYDPANGGSTGAAGPGRPAERWSVESDLITSSPAVVDGTAYVGGAVEGAVYAIDAGTGDERWTSSVDGSVYYTPTVSEGVIYVVADDSRIHALGTDGSREWSTDVADDLVSGCTVAGGMVYVSTIRGTLLALDADSGDEVWHGPGGSIECTPAVADGAVYSFGHREIDDTSRTVGVAVDAATGEEQWHYVWEGDGVLPYHAPAVGDEAVYVGTGGQELLALDRESGEELWLVDLNGYVTQPPVIAEGTLYVGVTPHTQPARIENGGSSVVALDATSGEDRWRRATEKYGAAVSMGSNLLYRRTLGGIAALDPAGGETIWTHDPAFGPPWDEVDGVSEHYNVVAGTSEPAVVDDTLVIASPSGAVYAVEQA